MAKTQPLDPTRQPTNVKLDKYFNMTIKAQASDLHMKCGHSPKVRVNGKLRKTTAEALTVEKLEELIFEILTPMKKQYLLENGDIDFAYELDEANRFRINVFRQRGLLSLIARRISTAIPSFEGLLMPPAVKKIATNLEGLIIVAGPTGCGKSTTIAAMIDYINSTRACHIVTIEDPIEFLHKDKMASISQREIGIDVVDFGTSLKSLMRQDPDVILIGEMRDPETIMAAMSAAETGHLVFGTLHAKDTASAIQRTMDQFPPQERELARQTFSLTCKAILNQRLVPGMKDSATRVPVVEILLDNPSVRKLISEAREDELIGVIRNFMQDGMQDFTHSLLSLVQNDLVDIKVACEYAPNVDELRMLMKGIKSGGRGIL